MRLIIEIVLLLLFLAVFSSIVSSNSLLLLNDKPPRNLTAVARAKYPCSQDRCTCDDKSFSVDCVYNPITNPTGAFVDLSLAQTNLQARFVYISSFPNVPSRAFENAQFATSETIFITIEAAESIALSAFETMGNLDTIASTDYSIEIELYRLKSAQIANYAFSSVRLKRLTFNSTAPPAVGGGSTYSFNLDSFAGAQSIDTLEFINCDQVCLFTSINKTFTINFDNKEILLNY